MNQFSLDNFVNECREVMSQDGDPIDRVERLVPSMYRLLKGDTGFLKPEHFISDPDHYARNAIYVEDNNSFSLYALVWSPAQFTFSAESGPDCSKGRGRHTSITSLVLGLDQQVIEAFKKTFPARSRPI